MRKTDTDRVGVWDYITNDQILLAGVTTSILLGLVQWLGILVYYWQTPPEIPLFYSHLVGIDQLAGKEWVLLIPAITTLSVIFSLILIWFSMSINKVFHQVISWLTSLIAFLGLVALVHIFILMF